MKEFKAVYYMSLIAVFIWIGWLYIGRWHPDESTVWRGKEPAADLVFDKGGKSGRLHCREGGGRVAEIPVTVTQKESAAHYLVKGGGILMEMMADNGGPDILICTNCELQRPACFLPSLWSVERRG